MARYRPAQIVFTPDERRALLASLRDAYQAREPMPRSLRAFCARHPVPAVVRDALVQLLASSGCDEHDLIEVFVALLAANNKEAEFAQTFLESLKGATMGERRFRDMRRDMSKAVFT